MNNVEKVEKFLLDKPGYIKSSYSDLALMLNVSREDVGQAVANVKKASLPKPSNPTVTFYNNEFEEFLKWKASKEIVKAAVNRKLPSVYKGNKDNVLVIGDLHAPFILEGYLEFCREQQEKFDCGTVIFIGDIVDAHSWSFHTHDVDGMSVSDEVNRAKKQLNEWYQVFPEAVVLYGNHDLLVARKAKVAGLSQHFIKDLGEILGAPTGWKFIHEYILNDVKYIHGSVGNAITRAKDERVSIVQGHLHSESFVEWSVSEKDAIFGMNVGCGLDHSAYAFEYAKPFPRKPIISCGIVLDKGTLPIIKLMKL